MTQEARPDMCLYHADCADGFTSAWIAHQRWGDGVDFIPVAYDKPPPPVRDKHVLMVDFSYKRAVLEDMADSASSVTVIDHHKTAQADLEPYVWGKDFGWEGPGRVIARDEFRKHVETVWSSRGRSNSGRNVEAWFDMEKSGAVLTHEFCYPNRKVSKLAEYVQDRDLWKFALPSSREVNAWIGSHEYAFDRWTTLHHRLHLSNTEDFMTILAEGAAVIRSNLRSMEEAVRLTRRKMTIGGHEVWVANLPRAWSSEGTQILAAEHPHSFAASYFDMVDGRKFSLRSLSGLGADVASIASGYGGGGHKHAAGFTVLNGWEGD